LCNYRGTWTDVLGFEFAAAAAAAAAAAVAAVAGAAAAAAAAAVHPPSLKIRLCADGWCCC